MVNFRLALTGLLKREFWHGRDWSGWTPARFIEELGGWIGRYNTERRSNALGGRTPAEFRAALGRAA
ncbi:IS3 family transposase [Collinsella sp. LCP19S3_A6]|uniref:IS3 family transposase n=1 Tax=Collinsella sp. LCP19S3_A6 TaxID=3438752 RepID=UPI003F93847C